jgi:hypothetical protein
MKYVDRGFLMLLIVGVIALAFIESRGGVRRFFADRSWMRIGSLQISDTPERPAPPTDSPSDTWGDGTQLFANPIAASEGADGTFIQPMSATTAGAIKIAASDLLNPDNIGKYFRDPDKGLIFVSLGNNPKDTTTRKPRPAPHGDDGSIFPQKASAYPDVTDYYRSNLSEWEGGAKGKNRAFPVSF